MEIDWTSSMQQTFEYYEVDPNTWKDKSLLQTIKDSTINRDLVVNTLGSATINATNLLGECYIRIYIVISQNGDTFRYPLGTYLVQTPSSSFDGKIKNMSLDAYTPLLELKENPPPLGYSLMKDQNIMNNAYMLVRENCRAPVVETETEDILQDDFVADPNDTWLTYINDLIGQCKYQLELDENGYILFAKKQSINELQPIWTFNDDNSSILLPDITLQHDLYGIPNVVQVIASTGSGVYEAEVVNDDINSPTSTINRGRRIIHRDTDPNLPGFPTRYQIDEYATLLLKQLSSVEYQVNFTHGFCPVRLGDCVRLNYTKAGLNDIKAKIIKQTINCKSGCTISETAVFTKNLWQD